MDTSSDGHITNEKEEDMKIGMGNDHGGYQLKLLLKDRLKQLGVEVVDFGSDSTDIVRYPYYAAKVCNAILEGQVDRGILICSTGIGMSIVANKFKGIKAALVSTSYQAKMTRAHNDSNVLCLGGKCIGEYEALDMVDIWLSTPFEGGRHIISLDILSEIEKKEFTDHPVDITDLIQGEAICVQPLLSNQ